MHREFYKVLDDHVNLVDDGLIYAAGEVSDTRHGLSTQLWEEGGREGGGRSKEISIAENA